MRNKAVYTANTSRGRVGRGGNARFPTFRLDHHGPTHQRTDKASYRVATPRLKMTKEKKRQRNCKIDLNRGKKLLSISYSVGSFLSFRFESILFRVCGKKKELAT